MPEITTSELVAAFSDDEAIAYGDSYIEALLKELTRYTDRMGRLLIELVLFFFAYLLVRQPGITEIIIGPIKVSDLSMIHKILPIVIAYIYFDLAVTTGMWDAKWDVYSETFEALYPTLHMYGLHSYISPTSILGDAPWLTNIWGETNPTLERISDKLQKVHYRVFQFAPIPISIWIGYDLQARYGLTDPLVLISLGVSGILVIQATIHIIAYIYRQYRQAEIAS